MGAKRPKSLVCYIPIVRFDVYWIQTDRQTNKQTIAKFIYRYRNKRNAILKCICLVLQKSMSELVRKNLKYDDYNK